MTQQEKQELLISLCSMLPYKIMVRTSVSSKPLTCEILSNIIEEKNNFIIRPYLRPMSSMTEDEEKAYNLLTPIVEVVFPCDAYPLIDWLNKKHFDYRGLIPRGLALEAPEEMYEIV